MGQSQSINLSISNPISFRQMLRGFDGFFADPQLFERYLELPQIPQHGKKTVRPKEPDGQKWGLLRYQAAQHG